MTSMIAMAMQFDEKTKTQKNFNAAWGENHVGILKPEHNSRHFSDSHVK